MLIFFYTMLIFLPSPLPRYGRDPEAERQAALIAKQEDDAGQKVEAFEPWDEPQTLEALQDKYIVECKFSGRCAGTTLVLCQSKKRDGVVDQVTGNQRFKLFMAALQQKSKHYVFFWH